MQVDAASQAHTVDEAFFSFPEWETAMIGVALRRITSAKFALES